MIGGKFLAAVSKRKVEMLGNLDLRGMPVLGSRYIPIQVLKKEGRGVKVVMFGGSRGGTSVLGIIQL